MLERLKRCIPLRCHTTRRHPIPKWAIVKIQPGSIRLTERTPLSPLYVEKALSGGSKGAKAENGVLQLYAPSLVPDFIARLCQQLINDPSSRGKVYRCLADFHTVEWIFFSEEDRDALGPSQWPQHKFFDATALPVPVDPDGGLHREHCARENHECYQWIFLSNQLVIRLTIWASGSANTRLEPCKFRLQFNPSPSHVEILAATASAFKCVSADNAGLQLTARLPLDISKAGILAAAKANGGRVIMQANAAEPDIVAKTVQYFIDADLTDYLRVGVDCTWQMDGAEWPSTLPAAEGVNWPVNGGAALRYTVPNCRLQPRYFKVPVIMWGRDGRVMKLQVRLRVDDLLFSGDDCGAAEECLDGVSQVSDERMPARVAGAFRRTWGSLKRSRIGRTASGYPEI